MRLGDKELIPTLDFLLLPHFRLSPSPSLLAFFFSLTTSTYTEAKCSRHRHLLVKPFQFIDVDHQTYEWGYSRNLQRKKEVSLDKKRRNLDKKTSNLDEKKRSDLYQSFLSIPINKYWLIHNITWKWKWLFCSSLKQKSLFIMFFVVNLFRF